MAPVRVMKRVWAQNVIVDEAVLRGRLDVLAARRVSAPNAEADAVEDTVRTLLDKAHNAAFRIDPRPGLLSNWWHGTLIEASYQNMHAAKAEIVQLYNVAELRSEIPEAVARVEGALNRNDPRLAEAHRLITQSANPDPIALRKVIEIGYAGSDQTHSRVRSFRNVIIVAALLLAAFLAAFVAYVSTNPNVVPLCFRPDGVTGTVLCPTSLAAAGHGGPSGNDVLAVTLLGLMGGALAAAISIRNGRGTSTPYDVPVVLALLKVPAGGLTAIAALIAIRGNFIPGLSSLDNQEQILAYALIFGYAQQLLTRLIDKQGESVLSSVPSKDAQSEQPNAVVVGPAPVSPVEPPAAVPSATPVAPAGPVVDDAPDADVPDADADDSDVPDDEARDVPGDVLDDSGTLEDLPENEPDEHGPVEPTEPGPEAAGPENPGTKGKP